MGRATRCLLLLTLSASAEDPSTTLDWEPDFLGWVAFRDYPLGPAPPEGVKPPADIADGRFGVLSLADGLRVAVADEAGGAARGLWVDTDLDGDLAEETPTPWKLSEGVQRTTDTVRIPVAGESEPCSATFLFQRREARDAIGVITRVHRRGWIEIGGRLRPVALVDGNGDLRFDNVDLDRVYVDLDGDGELRGVPGSFEKLRFGEAFDLSREGYAAEPSDPLGESARFRRLPKAPAPRRWISSPVPPPIQSLAPPPAEPFSDLVARFDEKRDLGTAAQYGTPEAFRILLRVAETSSTPSCAADATRFMGFTDYVGQADEVARLARAHPDLEVRCAAVAALHAMGAPERARVYEGILRETRDPKEKDLVEDVALHLAYFGTPQSRATLLAAFRNQPSRLIRLQVLQGSVGDPAGPPKELVDAALEEESELTKSQALDKCWRLRDPKARAVALEVLASNEDLGADLVGVAIRVVASDPDKAAMRALLPWAERKSNDTWRELFDALRLARDPEVTRALVDGLREPGVRTRALCADLLMWMRDPAIVPALVKAVAKEKDADAVGRMVRALGAQEGAPLDVFVKLARRADSPARADVLAVLARAGKGDPAALRIFKAALASRSAEDRILALDAAARTGDASFAPAILACLDHEAWQVRLAAAEALRGVRVREAVLPLIERLDKEESARVRDAIAETLFSLTGQDLLDAADAWRAWWKDNGATFAVPAKPPERKADEGGTVARFYGLPVRTERVCFVLDRSESMEGIHAGTGGKRTKMEVALEQLEAAVKRLPDRARVNVVVFDSEIDIWKKNLAPLSDGNRGALRDFLGKQVPKGTTNIYDALEAALLTEGVDSIFLLSDGEPTSGAYRETSAILYAVRRLNQTRRVAIHTVAVGRDSELLRRLAEENGGRYARR